MTDYLTYSQSTGEIKTDEGISLGIGWAGRGEGKNNPSWQHIVRTGPLPQGWYTIGTPEDHPRLGKFVMRLTPDFDNEMFGRNDFWIHGASTKPRHYGQESMGCIIQFRPSRVKIHESGVTRLWVTA
jgi:hypothetical protein